jgi:predicted MFS family arabinose efflux permease
MLYALAALSALALRDQPVTAAADKTLPSPANTLSAASRPGGRPLPVRFLAGVFLWITAWNASASMWPNFLDTLGYSKTAISSLWGLAAFIEMPAMWLVGYLSDVVGRAPLLAAGGGGVGLVMLGYVTLARVLPALIGVQVVRGFTFASYTATAMTFAAEHGDPTTRGSNSGLYNAASSGGELVGVLMGGTLAQAVGFETLFGVCAISGLLSSVCFWALRRQQAVSSARVPP